MRYFTKQGLLAAVLAVCAGSAMAGAGTLSIVVTPLSSQVTYSKAASTSPVRPALATTVGYTVAIANTGGNTINDIRFTGTVVATDPSEASSFLSADGATCTATGSTVSCSITQLKAYQAAPTFAVFFSAPIKNPAGTLPSGDTANCTATDCLAFNGSLYYAEQDNGGNPLGNSLITWPQQGPNLPAAIYVALGTFNINNVKSAVPKSGGTYFTGDGGITTAGDQFTTTIVVPAGFVVQSGTTTTSYTTAEILETTNTVLSDSNCVNFTACQKTVVTIPFTTFSPYLQIVLRLDASYIPHGLNINSINLHYYDDSSTTSTLIQPCASPTTPNSNGKPCIATRVYYKNRSVPGWTADLDGDFEWTLINTKNGGYSVD